VILAASQEKRQGTPSQVREKLYNLICRNNLVEREGKSNENTGCSEKNDEG